MDEIFRWSLIRLIAMDPADFSDDYEGNCFFSTSYFGNYEKIAGVFLVSVTQFQFARRIGTSSWLLGVQLILARNAFLAKFGPSCGHKPRLDNIHRRNQKSAACGCNYSTIHRWQLIANIQLILGNNMNQSTISSGDFLFWENIKVVDFFLVAANQIRAVNRGCRLIVKDQRILPKNSFNFKSEETADCKGCSWS